jgi:hypothetical protein
MHRREDTKSRRTRVVPSSLVPDVARNTSLTDARRSICYLSGVTKPTILLAGSLVAAATILVTGLSSSATAARSACGTQVFQNGPDVVFGRAKTEAAANVIAARAQRVGFKDAKVVQEGCNVWKAVLRGLDSFQTAVAVQSEARRGRLSPTVECVTADQIGQVQAVFGTRPTLGELDDVVQRARSFGYVGLKTKRAPCGGYQAYVAGFRDRPQADDFAQTARQRTGLPVAIIVA